MLGGKFVILNKEGTVESNETVQKLYDMTNISDKSLTKACQVLISKLISYPPSMREIRSVLRCHPLNMEEPFDFIAHSGLSFVEMVCIHFINMFDSLQNPMQQAQLERNTAFLTTMPVLHSLFLDCNDLINMQWVEKQTPLRAMQGGMVLLLWRPIQK
ncbi:hypothetical protein BCV72DRAFT_4109 [Rhizopus microsporus var. microsporus]|uniref:Uncharacterized protein n=1 Tax=Rhizopus microsporus var. microsporus TaxID=86635 RepID=A0A1X0QZH4_RHIZD|nr:hypothetical protein BCV72DRAFT_4109 [Rhizopus microsporus var. microsporus]